MIGLRHLGCVTALAVALLGAPAYAGDKTVRDFADQAVLVHRITKSACLMFVGSATTVHAEDVKTSSTELLALALEPTENGRADEALDVQLATLTRSAGQIAEGDRHTVPVSLLLNTNPILADRFHKKRQEASSGVRKSHHKAYVLVHDLRVISQAFQRDLCLFLTDLAPADADRRLSDRIALFDTALDQLVAGDPAAGLEPAPNIHIKVTLGKVAGKWKTLKPILQSAAAKEALDPRDVQLASVLGDAILKNFDEIADLFQKL